MKTSSSTLPPAPSSFTVAWRQNRPGLVNGEHYINGNRPEAGEISRRETGKAPITLKLDGDDYSYMISERKTVGREGMFGFSTGSRTNAIGYADGASDRGKALAALEQAVAAANALGRGNASPMSTAADVITMNLRAQGIQPRSESSAWKLSGAPAEVLRVRDLAQQLADAADGVKTEDLGSIDLP